MIKSSDNQEECKGVTKHIYSDNNLAKKAILNDVYEIQKLIGTGFSANVYMAKNISNG